jgi:hypothetical protein
MEKVTGRLSNNKLKITERGNSERKLQKCVPSFKLLPGCENAIGDDMQEMDQSKLKTVAYS